MRYVLYRAPPSRHNGHLMAVFIEVARASIHKPGRTNVKELRSSSFLATVVVASAITIGAMILVPVTPAYAFTKGEGSGPNWCSTYGGKNLDNFKNIYACELTSKNPTAGETPFDSYPGFQCTELANRFLYNVTGNTIFNNAEVGGNFAALAAKAYSIPTGNSGTTNLPTAGDIISMWGGTSKQPEAGSDSHVAVVTNVTTVTSGWRIATLNQNDKSDTDGEDGINYITVTNDGKTWSFNSGFYGTFEWLKLATSVSGNWTATEAPLPANGVAADGSFLSSVACPSPSACVSVGGYTDSSMDQLAMILSRSGTSWMATEAPLPANAYSGSGISLSDLGSVACSSVTNCVAAGGYSNSSAVGEAFVVAGSGTSWKATAVQLPKNSISADNPPDISSIACPSAAKCVAVGDYTDSSDNSQGLLVTGAGSSWTATQALLPSNSGTAAALLTSVACASASVCAATGELTSSSSDMNGLLLTMSGSSWTATKAPLPKGAGKNANPTISSVACPSLTKCIAVGSYTDSSGNVQGLLETGLGSSWTANRAPLPPNGAGGSLSSVACPSTSACVAVGNYSNYTSGQGLVLTMSGSSWTAAEAPAPTNGATNPEVLPGAAIGCASTTQCVTVDSYLDSSSDWQGLLLSLSGSSWTAAEAPLPNGLSWNNIGPLSVGCASPLRCVAISNYFSSTAGIGVLLSMSG
jgi:CHAP domain